MIPDYLASLVQLPEKFGPDKRWAARSLSGDFGYGHTASEAVQTLTQAVLEREALERLKKVESELKNKTAH